MRDIQTDLYLKTKELVKKHIYGTRDGILDAPAYEHSFRVATILGLHGYSEPVRIAGLLHDIIEDAHFTPAMLKEYGYSDEVIHLVEMCSHDVTIENHDVRWTLLMIKLAKEENADAWAIKLADILDNYLDSYGLAPQREFIMRTIKLPIILSATRGSLSTTSLWQTLQKLHTITYSCIEDTQRYADNLRRELHENIKLDKTSLLKLDQLCDDIERHNRGIANPYLFQAINTFHDTAIKISSEPKLCSTPDLLETLANGLCGDLLNIFAKGRAMKAEIRPSVDDPREI